MKNIQTIFISIALCVVSIVAVVALSAVTHATTCVGATYTVEVDVERGVAKTFAVSDLSSDFVTHFTGCGRSLSSLYADPADRYAVGSVVVSGGTITITAEYDLYEQLLRIYGGTEKPYVDLNIIVSLGSGGTQTPVANDNNEVEQTSDSIDGEQNSDDSDDADASDDTGAIVPGYITCVVAKRNTCGSVNSDARNSSGIGSQSMPQNDLYVFEGPVSEPTVETVVEKEGEKEETNLYFALPEWSAFDDLKYSVSSALPRWL